MSEGAQALAPSRVDSASAFDMACATADQRSAEQWARAVFEEPGPVTRAVLVLGWRMVLRLRLGPRPASDHVLGWRIRSARPDLVVLEQDSPVVTAINVVQVDNGHVVWTTFVAYRNIAGRIAWALVLPVHVNTVPRLLRRAARNHPGWNRDKSGG